MTQKPPPYTPIVHKHRPKRSERTRIRRAHKATRQFHFDHNYSLARLPGSTSNELRFFDEGTVIYH